MKKIISLFIILLFPTLSFSQVSKYQGKYHAMSLSIFGAEKMKSDFEVNADGVIKGTITMGEKDEIVLQDLKGITNHKGKFEAQLTQADGSIFSINGILPIDKQKGTISFVQKKIIKGNGSKNVSESGATGFIIRLSEAESAEEIKFEDTGKTQLLFGNSTILFSNVWTPVTAIFDTTSYQTNNFKKIEITDESGDSIRYLRFALPEKADKKTWLASEGFTVSYRETIGTVINSYMIRQSGKIELISENDNEIVFRVSNLQVKKILGEDRVRIDGYIHAIKTE